MILKNKKYLVLASILGCLILGLVIGKAIVPSFQKSNSFILPSDASVIARDIVLYTQHANKIVIGNVASVNDPYISDKHGIILQQDATIDIQQVLKGDANMKAVTVSDLANPIGRYDPNNLALLKGKTGLLAPGEKVLLFLGINGVGENVVFAQEYGKYLIDANNNVSSAGDFKMSLQDLKSQIETALKLPVPAHIQQDISKEI